jgi:hypothetical protein
MNTPKPCDSCKNLYWNCTTEDDPSDMAECKYEMPMGDMFCKGYQKDKGHEWKQT